jgi:hypothetical protein
VPCVLFLNKDEIRRSESNSAGNFSIMGGHLSIQNSGGTNTPEGVSIFVNQPAINFFTAYPTSASCVRLTEEMSSGQLRIVIIENLGESIGDITRSFKVSASRTEHVVNQNVPKIIVPLAVATTATGCLVD